MVDCTEKNKGKHDNVVYRHIQVAPLPDICNEERPCSAASTLNDLLGTPRKPMGFQVVTFYYGETKLKERLDVDKDVSRISCGRDHILFQAENEDALFGLGMNWNKQVRINWYKSKKSLLKFSKPVQCDLLQNEFEEDDPILKGFSLEELKLYHERDLELPQLDAFGTYGDSSCVAYDQVVKWSKMNMITLRVPVKVSQVALGRNHVLIRGENKVVYGYGDSSRGQLGFIPSINTKTVVPSNEEQLEPVCPIKLVDRIDYISACFDSSYCVRGNKIFNLCGTVLHAFVEPIMQVSCGRDHIVVLLKNSRKVFAWGNNNKGAVGVTRPKQPVGGYYDQPQLINGRIGPLWHKSEIVEQIGAGEYHSVLRTNQGDVYLWGTINKNEIKLRPQKLENYKQVKRVSAGPNYLVIVQ